MRKSLKNLLRLGLLAGVAGAASACVVDPGYGYYGPGYYGPSVYVAPGYYGGGYYHHHHDYDDDEREHGYHHWR
jgi:hypothetical protein